MLIAIEGIDGSGKGTQAKLLKDRLESLNVRHLSLSFPDYESEPYGKMVGRYLNGDFGTEVAPELAALLYASDRAAYRDTIVNTLDAGCMVVCDRYVHSNLAHQGARAKPQDRTRLDEWIRELEFTHNRMPIPDLVIILDVPIEISMENVKQKMARRYTDRKADLHEVDAHHLAETLKIYRGFASQIAEEKVEVIYCLHDGKLMHPDRISQRIWDTIVRKKFNQTQ